MNHIEERARELLAAEYAADLLPDDARSQIIRTFPWDNLSWAQQASIRAVMVALQQPQLSANPASQTELERELCEALENDALFFDSIANNEHWEATGIGNLCRGYALRRRELLARARGESPPSTEGE